MGFVVFSVACLHLCRQETCQVLMRVSCHRAAFPPCIHVKILSVVESATFCGKRVGLHIRFVKIMEAGGID